MAKEIGIVIPHQLGVVEAEQRLKAGLEALKGEFGAYFSAVHEHWTGSHVEFSVQAMGTTASGMADVTANAVRVRFQLPILLRPFARKFRAYVAEKGPEFFA